MTEPEAALIDVFPPAPQETPPVRTRKRRSDAGVPKKLKASEPAQPPAGSMTASQRERAAQLLQALEDAHQALYRAQDKYSRAHADFNDYLDSITAKQGASNGQRI